jgi:alpha-tubulin suppressor-like RCC1 family protein
MATSHALTRFLTVLCCLLISACNQPRTVRSDGTAVPPPSAIFSPEAIDTAAPSLTPKPTFTLTPEEGSPTALPSLEEAMLSDSPIVDVAIGAATLMLREDGRVWGMGWSSALGLPKTDLILTPTLMENIDHVDAIFASRYYSAFLRDGKLTTMNLYRDGEITTFEEIDEIVQVDGDGETVIVRRSDGTVWAIGGYDLLGSDSVEVTEEFTEIPITDVIDIAMHGYDVLALKRDGSVWQWSTDPSIAQPQPPVPEQVARLADVIDVAWGQGIVAVHANGSVSVIRFSVEDAAPLIVPRNVVRVEGGLDGTAFLIADDGSLWGTGLGFEELGPGLVPTPTNYRDEAFMTSAVQTLVNNVVDVSTSLSASLALDENGTVWAWGYGTIYDGERLEYQMPTPFPIMRSR